MSGDLRLAAQLLVEDNQSLVVVREGQLLFCSRLQGIEPYLDALDNGVLSGSAIAAKTVGRASAMVVALGQATAVHSPLMSEGAADVLGDAGILYHAGEIVARLLSPEGNGPCPFEIATEFTVVPEKGVHALRKLLKDLHTALPPEQLH